MKKILVADDDYLLRDLIKDVLEEKNYEVLEAKDGREAVEIFHQNPEISLVILDVMMLNTMAWKSEENPAAIRCAGFDADGVRRYAE